MGSKDISIYVICMDILCTTAATWYVEPTKKKLEQWGKNISNADESDWQILFNQEVRPTFERKRLMTYTGSTKYQT